MKKKIISICITLFLFLSCPLNIFAYDSFDGEHEYVPPWLYDLALQSYWSNGCGETGYFGALIDSNTGDIPYSTFLNYGLVIFKYNTMTFTYDVEPGETVYFRFAVGKQNLRNQDSITVNLLVNGTFVLEDTYSIVNDGTFGTQSTIVIVDDYTNTSNNTVTVRYGLWNNSIDAQTFIPLLVGNSVLINSGEFASVPNDILGTIDFDTSDIVDELVIISNSLSDIDSNVSDIKTLLSDIKTLYQSYSINGQIVLNDMVDGIYNMIDEIRSIHLVNIYDAITSGFSSLLSPLNELVNLFKDSERVIIDNSSNTTNNIVINDNASITNNDLTDISNQINTYEDNYVSSMNSKINNLPSLDWGHYTYKFPDFTPTVQFISGCMTDIYNVNPNIQFLINISLLLGIAFLLIGRSVK